MDEVTPRRPSTKRHKLEWLEAGRGLAAAAVMVSHGHIVMPMPEPYILGDLGVAFFFALSGFIIHFIHHEDIGVPKRGAYFAWRRLTRILPTYWLILCIWLAINHLQKPFARFHLDGLTVAGQFVLRPDRPTLLGPAWTLQYEFLFYFMFLTLIVARPVGRLLLGLWLLVLAGQFTMVGIFVGPLPAGVMPRPGDMLLHHLNFYFFAGLLLGVAYQRGRIGLYLGVSVAAAAILLAAAMVPGADIRFRAAGFVFLFGGIVALLVLGSQRSVPCPRWLVTLGAISFVLYLIHIPVFVALRGVVNIVGRYITLSWWMVLPVQMAIAIVVAAIFYILFDRPVVRWLGAHGPARRPVASAG